MCGIVGYIGPKQAAPILLDGLSKLEYRGYDSAGLAVRDGEKEFEVVKAKGRLKKLAEKTDDAGLRTIMTAVRRSDRLMGEDLIRETGFLLPQSGEVRRMLEAFVADPPEGFPVEAARELLRTMRFNS